MAGLVNFGNTCYLNSILQCLFSIETFKTRIVCGDLLYNIAVNILDNDPELDQEDEKTIKHRLKQNLKLCVTYQMYLLFNQMHKKKQRQIALFPESFKTVIGNKCDLDVDDQNDTHEMLSFILDHLEREMKNKAQVCFTTVDKPVQKYLDFEASCMARIKDEPCAKRKTKIEQILAQYKDINRDAVNAADSHTMYKQYIESNHSIVSDLFLGQLCSKLQCEKTYNSSSRYEMFFMLSLPIPATNTLDDQYNLRDDASLDTDYQSEKSDNQHDDHTDKHSDDQSDKHSDDQSDKHSDDQSDDQLDNHSEKSDDHSEKSDDQPDDQPDDPPDDELLTNNDPLEKTKVQSSRYDTTMISIHECFAEFIKKEILNPEDQWYCDKCKQKTPSSKSLAISIAPNVLIVHFNRFRKTMFSCRKNSIMIDFPLVGLDISNYVDQCTHSAQSNLVYDLVAVNNHYGTIQDGHYDSYCKHGNQWYHCNDDKVEPIDDANVVTSSAYILFYKKRDIQYSYNIQPIET